MMWHVHHNFNVQTLKNETYCHHRLSPSPLPFFPLLHMLSMLLIMSVNVLVFFVIVLVAMAIFKVIFLPHFLFVFVWFFGFDFRSQMCANV